MPEPTNQPNPTASETQAALVPGAGGLGGAGQVLTLQNAIIAAAMAGAALVVWGYRRLSGKSGSASRSPDPSAGPPIDEVAEVARLRADLAELGERLAQELDERAERIEGLLARADDSIARLDAAAARAERHPPREAWRATTVARPDWPEPKRSSAEQPASGVEHPIPDLVHRRIVELAEDGLAASEIASRLEHPIGQVELVIALHRSHLTR